VLEGDYTRVVGVVWFMYMCGRKKGETKELERRKVERKEKEWRMTR
jgi:hypothetical protein